jgi:hypothetical protein
MDLLNADYIARINLDDAKLYDLDDIYDDGVNNKYVGPEVQFYHNHAHHKTYNTNYVIARFYEQYPYLVGVDLTNLYIAGGAISQFVKHKFISPDIDVFIYGLNAEQANARVLKFINDVELNIFTKYSLIIPPCNGYGFYGPDTELVKNTIVKTKAKYAPDFTQFTLSKTHNISPEEWDLFMCVHSSYYPKSSVVSPTKVMFGLNTHKSHSVITDYSVTVDFGMTNTRIQIISRLYKSKKEILYGFDLGSCAVGFDGKSIEFSIAGKFAQEYNLNILDTTRFSLNHGARLKKYFDRGYGIIFPLCNKITEKQPRMTIRFYNMFFTYSSTEFANKNKLPARYFVKMYTNSTGNCDYSHDKVTYMESKETIYLKNTIYKLANGHRGFYIYGDFYNLTQISTIFARLPTINLVEIEKFYKYFHTKVWKNGNLDMQTIISYIPEFDFVEFVSIVKSKSENPSKYIQERAIKQFDNIKKTVDLLNIIENPQPYIGIKWIDSDVMSQKSLLTGSFHPVYMDNEKFYTDQYFSSDKASQLITHSNTQ